MKFSELEGRTLSEILIVRDEPDKVDSITFVTDEGTRFVLKSENNNSMIHSITGDLGKIINNPIIEAEKYYSEDTNTILYKIDNSEKELWIRWVERTIETDVVFESA